MDSHIDPRTGRPYPVINEYTFIRLPEAARRLYKWQRAYNRFIYQGELCQESKDDEQ